MGGDFCSWMNIFPQCGQRMCPESMRSCSFGGIEAPHSVQVALSDSRTFLRSIRLRGMGKCGLNYIASPRSQQRFPRSASLSPCRGLSNSASKPCVQK
jgi:hypothetical protein